MLNWNNKLVRINLSNSQITEEEIPEDIQEKYIGGRGLGVKYLYDELPPGTDPLSPENIIIFATGPVTGTRTPLSGRYVVVSKAPLTGAVTDSHSGGHFGTQLKYCGVDMFILNGKAPEWSYISITPEAIELHSAEELIGLNTAETTDKLQEIYGSRSSVACIGPAGENLVRLACIINDKGRAAGRGGLGAVLGSKNIKAIVASSTVKKTRTEEQQNVRKHVLNLLKKNSITKNGLPIHGTAVLVNIINEHGIFPTRNFQEGVFNDAEGISGEKLTERFLVGRTACEGCTIGCGRKTRISPEREGEGPEFETVWSFGSQCDINNLETIIEANYLCNELGMDTISLGSTIGAAMELTELGLIPNGPKFGDDKAVLDLVKRAAYGKDELGKLIGDGSYRLGEFYDRTEVSMTSKKLEMPAYDPRGVVGQGLSYATSNRGGCHMRGYMIMNEIMGSPVLMDRFDPENKHSIVIMLQNLSAFVDALIMCRFTQIALSIPDYRKIYNAFTGSNIADEDVLEIGARIFNLERAFNNREGFTREDDTLPPRLLSEPMPAGPARGKVVPLDEMLNRYYEERGWSQEGEVPEELV
jgi:aldehyde:ferredoxin oxidoreductase